MTSRRDVTKFPSPTYFSLYMCSRYEIADEVELDENLSTVSGEVLQPEAMNK